MKIFNVIHQITQDIDGFTTNLDQSIRLCDEIKNKIIELKSNLASKIDEKVIDITNNFDSYNQDLLLSFTGKNLNEMSDHMVEELTEILDYVNREFDRAVKIITDKGSGKCE